MDYFGKLEKAETPNEMREALYRISMDNAQVRNILDHARYNGLSGEDTYVILAYELLKENIPFKELAVKQAMFDIKPVVIKKTSDS